MGRGMKAGRKPKNSITITQEDLKHLERVARKYEQEERKRILDSMKDALAEEVGKALSYRHNIDMIAVMFALRDEYGFGKSRLIRAIKTASAHAERMILDDADLDEMLEVLKTETGISEDELIWDFEVEM